MKGTNTDPNKKETPSRKSSAIPRLYQKRNTVEAIIPGKFEEENFEHVTKSPDVNKEDRASCFCTGCYNKSKNLCRFTLNENLIQNLQNDDETDKGSYNGTEDDDVNSTTIMTDGESYCTEDNFANHDKRGDYNKRGQTNLPVEEITSSEPNSLSNRNYDVFLHDTSTTVPTKEPKEIAKELQKTGFNPTELKMRQNGEPEKYSTDPDRNKCSVLRRTKAKSTEHVEGCLVKVSTRNRLKYTLTNVRKYRPKSEKACFSKESNGSSSRCLTPTELHLQERREKFSDLNVAKLLDVPNFKDCDENNSLSHLFKTGNLWDNNVSDLQASKPKNCECVSQANCDTLLNNKCDCLMNALLEVFGNDSHITKKIRNSTMAKNDTRFRNIRSAESYDLNSESGDESKIKTHTCRSYPSIESDLFKSNVGSVHTFSTLGKSLPETFSSAVRSADKSFKRSQRGTCISLKRCKCRSLKCCYQLDELNESITSMQTEIKTLIKSMPCGKKCACTISEEIAKLKQFYQDCQQNERKRNLQQRKLEYDIKEIYRKIDELTEANRGPSFFKYFVVIPFVGILTVYTVSCLVEFKKN